MISKIKKPVSILLAFMMIVSLFAIVPVTASAAVGDFVQEKDYLTFTAEEAGSSVTLNVSTGSNLKYNLNGAGWESYSKGTQITLANVGDYVRFCGNNTTFDEYNHHVSIGGKVACSGNVMSLRLDDNGKSQGLSYDCFDNMFMDCTGLTAAPELPETNLAESCYYCMFYGCTSLTTAPALPATALADYCYYGMFAGCTSLTTAPVLPATMLDLGCYSSMFYGCTQLTTAPELPATMLAQACYSGMFAYCTSLTTAPELPATTLAEDCYSGMFYGCERLTTAPELPATTLAQACYCYMFEGCTSLTTAPALPATTLAPSCYDSMFSGCSSIKLSETQTAEYSIPYSVPSGGNGTTADYALDNMFDGTGGTFKGTPEIDKIYYRPAVKYTVTWKNGDDVIKTDTVEEGATPTYDGETPTKAEDENYTYTFSGWKNGTNTYGKDETLPAVTADVTYTAQFDAYPKSGSFDGLNWSIDDEGTLTLSGSGAIPAEAFKSNPVIKKVIINSSVTGVGANAFADCANLADLTFDSKSPINFAGGYTYLTDKTTVNVPAGSTYQYTVQVTTIATEKTAYKDVLPTLQAEFKEEVAWGTNYEEALSIVLENYADWVQQQTGEYPVADEFEFVLEDEERTGNLTDGQKCETVFGNANIHVFVPTYTVTWKNGDTTLKTDTVDKDAIPAYDGNTPVKDENEQYSYTFTGWTDSSNNFHSKDSELPAASKDETYTATYSETLRSYTITWKDGDDNTLKSESVAYGTTPSYTGETPTKTEDDAYTYEFNNTWSPSVASVTGNATYTAQFDATPKVVELPDVIKDCTNTRDSVIFANVPFIQPGDFSTLADGAINFVSLQGGFALFDAKDYSYKFYDKNGTEIAATLSKEQSVPGSVVGLSDDVTIYNKEYQLSNTELDKYYIVATAPAPAKLITRQSISLDGNIGINFYLDPAAAGLTVDQVTTEKLSYTFAWANNNSGKAKVEVSAQSGSTFVKDGELIKVTCYVCAAEMTCGVDATFKLNGKTEKKTYSVREYCDSVIKATPAQIDELFGGTEKYNKLVELVKAMLNYGAMAQTKFKVNTGYLANNKVDYNPGDVDGDMLDTAIAAANGTDKAANMNDVAAQHGAKWFSTSLIYLDDSTLRHYFVKATDTFKPSDYTRNKSNYYYYVEVTGIPAAELDNLQTFKVGNDTFKYSALDFVKGMINSSADGDSKSLAKSLYWYNQAANDYFPAPAEKILVLDDVTEDTTVENGYTITGTLKGDYKISIADGATVTLKDVYITCLSNDKATVNFAGITPLGDATILLEGTNTVKGGYENYPGVFVPVGKTLTIDGTGSLNASSNGYGCGIGGGCEIQAGNIVINSGNIVINGGTIIATGGKDAAGIGSGGNCSCGNITITGGTITANGGAQAAGIGSGYDDATCGNILITGGTVTATGGNYAAGIGSGLKGNCSNITIADTVTKVTATKGSPLSETIGKGFGGSCGTVTIGGVVKGRITDSPYIYPTLT